MKTPETENTFDVCILALADLRTDARTYNIALALVHSGKRVCVIAPDWGEGIQFAGLVMIYVPCRDSGRLWRKWMDFTKNAIPAGMKINAKSFWAEDLWSLRAASILARRKRSRLLYDSREIYSALGPLHKRPIMQAIIATMERRYSRYADIIIVSGELDAEYIRQHLKRNAKPKVVMNVPSYSEPEHTQKLRQHFDIPAACPIVVYQGVILEGRGIEPMIRALALAPEFHFCIIGDGPSRTDMLMLVEDCGVIRQVHFSGSIPNKELSEWTASADIGLCFVVPISFSYKLALPNKLFEYAMARIPTLVSDLPAMRRIIEQYPFGELISASATSAEIASALRNIWFKKDSYRSHADAAAKVFNREAQEKIIAGICEELENS